MQSMQAMPPERMLRLLKKAARLAGSQLDIERMETYRAMAAELERLMRENDELKKHPDTERLDWLSDPANKIGNVILPGWCSDEYNSLRDAIDAAMQEQAAEAKE